MSRKDEDEPFGDDDDPLAALLDGQRGHAAARAPGGRLLLVGVGVFARRRSRPALARPGRRRYLVEAGVVVGQRAAEGAAEHGG